jgi:hypothetical protein
MFMEIILSDMSGNTESIDVLRGNIQTQLNLGNSVLVKLLQPGIMYKEEKDWYCGSCEHGPMMENDTNCTRCGVEHSANSHHWLTVIDFMNEWEGKPVRFQSNLVPLKECKVQFDYSNDMFFAGPRLYQENHKCVALLSKLKSVEDKHTNKHWDLLLGEVSNNKDFLFTAIRNHAVLDKTFLTYFGKDTNKGHWSADVVRPKEHTAETVGLLEDRFDTQLRCSDLLDPEIYNSTYYTAMIETTIHNDFAMFSEKEAKPIVAQRPFIVFGARNQLKAFRSIGFKTFDGVIDESYDVIDDKVQRWNQALDSMMALTDKDPIEVYATLKDVLAHNKDHFENSNWKRCLTWDSYQ